MRTIVPIATTLTLTALTFTGFAAPLAGQGRAGTQYLNFEAPVHQPITVVRVGNQDFLLVANTSDNSVEVFTTAATPAFLFRVPVGQLPVTVVARPTPTAAGGRQIYVANWLGDSISVFDLVPSASGPGGLAFRWVTTQPVGDEPVGIAFQPENPSEPWTLPGGLFHEVLFVTFSAPAQWGVFQPGTLAPVLNGLELMHNDPTSAVVNVALRDPRALAFAPPPVGGGAAPTQLWVLNHRGGNDPNTYDFDLWGSNSLFASATSGFANLPRRGDLGTTNFQMAFAANGDLYVVGQLARNKDPQLGPNLRDVAGEPIHQSMVVNETGFVTSFLARYRNVAGAGATLESLDLNDQNQGLGTILQASQPITQPTDVVVRGNGGLGTQLFVTGFNSDSLAVVTVGAASMSTWTVGRVSLAHPTNAFALNNLSGVMRGPRALALLRGATSASDRLFVYNRVDNSVTVVDPTTTPPTVGATVALQGQIEPAYIRDGRKFLYSSRLSGGGNASCASCHIDGNTDFLAWNLADGAAIPSPTNPFAFPLPGSLGPNNALKGQMVTQPLRGLINFEISDPIVQDLLFSNRPYHWRGDKGFLEQFNAAFVNLLGMLNIASMAPTGAWNKGLPDTEMTQFREFVFSMHYPPNPLQPWQRVYSGALGNPADNSAGDGASGGQLGLKIFHTVPTVGAVSCVHCHTLPEGSNNLLTETVGSNGSALGLEQSIETAQLKALVVKERRLLRSSFTAPSGPITFTTLPTGGGPPAVSHEFGLAHTGQSDITLGGVLVGQGTTTINSFVNGFIFPLLPRHPDAVSLYLREFDSGVSPLIGFSGSVDTTLFNATPASVISVVNDLEGQANAANAALAVHARMGGVLRGFAFDVNDPVTPYHEEPRAGLATIGPLSQTALLDFLRTGTASFNVDNLLIFHATPLGSARRVAQIDGGLAAPLASGAPSGVTLLGARPMTANRIVPQITNNFADLVANCTLSNLGGQSTQSALALFQQSLVTWAPGGFGLTQLRHEAPRRFRVSGSGIEDGAVVRIWAPTLADFNTATATTPPTTVPNFSFTHLEFPLYPVDDDTGVNWETAVEIEPLHLLALMNGWPTGGFANFAFDDPTNAAWYPTPGCNYVVTSFNFFNPARWNWFWVEVANVTPTGLAVSGGSWQRLTLQ